MGGHGPDTNLETEDYFDLDDETWTSLVHRKPNYVATLSRQQKMGNIFQISLCSQGTMSGFEGSQQGGYIVLDFEVKIPLEPLFIWPIDI